MKKITLIVGLIMSGSFSQAQGLEGIIVEKYYLTDADDSTSASDNVAITELNTGSITYRVFVDMATDYKFIQMYGSAGHDFKINTTTDFYNDPNNGSVFPQGTSVTNTRKNTTMIDSWLSVGGVATGQMGVLKIEDTDGSIGNQHNILANDAGGEFGFPINGTNAQDGLMPGSPITPNALGFTTELDVFDQTAGNSFLTNGGAIAALGGASGITASNTILIGQFTTDGVLSFELNIQLGTPTPGGSEIYVARDAVDAEIQDSSLIYTSLVEEDTTTNTDALFEVKLNKPSFSIYPNPASDEFTLFILNSIGGCNNFYMIQDITGNLVTRNKLSSFTGNFAKNIDVNTFPSGVYFVTVSVDDTLSTLKFIKK